VVLLDIKKGGILLFIVGLFLGLGLGLIISVSIVKPMDEIVVSRLAMLAEKAIYISDIVRATDVAYIIPVAVYASYSALKANTITDLKILPPPEVYLERPIDLVNTTLNSLRSSKPPSEVKELHELLINKFSVLLAKLLDFKGNVKSGDLEPLDALREYREISNICSEILNLTKAISNTLRESV